MGWRKWNGEWVAGGGMLCGWRRTEGTLPQHSISKFNKKPFVFGTRALKTLSQGLLAFHGATWLTHPFQLRPCLRYILHVRCTFTLRIFSNNFTFSLCGWYFFLQSHVRYCVFCVCACVCVCVCGRGMCLYNFKWFCWGCGSDVWRLLKREFSLRPNTESLPWEKRDSVAWL